MLFVLLSTTFALGARGEVTHKQSGCDYFVVATPAGYDLLEWYGGYDPDKGDFLVGKFETYGMQDIYDQTADDNLRVWVEDYWLSKEDALEKLVEHCE
jgi:hypothetical protein